MNEPNSKPEKQKERQLTGQEQYDMLKRCSDKKDLTEWNDWRKKHPDEDILLSGRIFKGFWLEKANFIGKTVWNQSDGTSINFTSEVHLEKANFEWAHLQKAIFGKAHLEESCFWSAKVQGADFHSAHLDNAELGVAHFENCDFTDAILENANLTPSELNGAKFIDSNLRGCSMRMCVVDGSTRFWNCTINRYSKDERFTDLTGTALDNVLIKFGQKQLLEYNIRRQSWEVWYDDENEPIRDGILIFLNKKIRLKTNKILTWSVRKFWQISDYGISTKSIIKTFFKWAMVFAIVYYLWGAIEYYHYGVNDNPGIVANLFIDENGPIEYCLVPIRSIYFSIVTMTTLGFGDMYANAHNYNWGWLGHIILSIQVILGYVLLGALVTRFAVLFTAGGPAGKFADDKEKEDKEKKNR